VGGVRSDRRRSRGAQHPVHAHPRRRAGGRRRELYAATPNGFTGKESQLAAILGAWAPGAVHNADLSFSTRAEARRATEVLEELAILNQATGVVVAAHAVDVEAARQIITDAAHRAGQDELEVARALIRPFLQDQDAT